MVAMEDGSRAFQANVNEDSGDEWLRELLCTRQDEAYSSDEWLQELFHAPRPHVVPTIVSFPVAITPRPQPHAPKPHVVPTAVSFQPLCRFQSPSPPTMLAWEKRDRFVTEMLASAQGKTAEAPAELPAQDEIVHALHTNACTGHCLVRLAKWLVRLGPAIFKIGIAAIARDRWELHTLEHRWHFMEVWYFGQACVCRQLEIDLIAQVGDILSCQHIKNGGDGVRPDRTHQCCVYCVFAGAGDASMEANARHRRKKSRLHNQNKSGQPVVPVEHGRG